MDAGQYRLSYQALPGQLEQAHSAVVGVNRRFLASEMANLDRMVLMVGGIVLLVAPIGGYVLAGRTTRILAHLTERTASLRPTALHERLPIRGSGDELDALAVTINGLLDRLGAYLQQKQDFLANAAHELRTPLAAIRSSVEVSLNGDRNQDEYRLLLDEVIEQCASLQALVNQLLLLAESDANDLETKHSVVQLDRLVSRAVEMFRGVAEDKGIEIVLETLSAVSVSGNADHLRQLLNNLLDNSIKFTAARTAQSKNAAVSEVSALVIRVRLSHDVMAKRCRLEVHDSGIGISEEDQSRLFERFFRSDRARSRENATAGTGLGLAICKAIVAEHQGTIEVQSSLGEGTSMLVTLPILADKPPEE